jgi:hypothetical protein
VCEVLFEIQMLFEKGVENFVRIHGRLGRLGTRTVFLRCFTKDFDVEKNERLVGRNVDKVQHICLVLQPVLQRAFTTLDETE